MDLKGKRLVIIKILIDLDKDEFGTDVAFQGFENKTPKLLDKLLVSSILDEIKKQMVVELEVSNK